MYRFCNHTLKIHRLLLVEIYIFRDESFRKAFLTRYIHLYFLYIFFPLSNDGSVLYHWLREIKKNSIPSSQMLVKGT